MPIHYDKTIEAFKALGAIDFDVYYGQQKQIDLFHPFERGEITSEYFCHVVRQALKLPSLTNEQIETAWLKMLGELTKEKIDWVLNLKKHYRIFLLSNTNAIHLTEIIKRFDQYGGLQKIFERTYFSCELGLHKPQAEIFKKVLKENNLIPDETLLIDDTEEHIQTARTHGIQTYHLTSNKDLIPILSLLQHP